MMVPSGWEKKGKAGADVLFEDPDRRYVGVHVVVGVSTGVCVCVCVCGVVCMCVMHIGCLVKSVIYSDQNGLGLARTVYIRCIYGILGRDPTKYTVIYVAYLRFWPTLKIVQQ